MKSIPIFLNMEGKKVLIIGGGQAALIKTKTLLDFELDVTIVAPKIIEELLSFEKQEKLKIKRKWFSIEDLEGYYLVILAADAETNRLIAKDCHKKEIMVSSVSQKEEGDFFFPSHKKQGEMVATVSTNGLFPILGKRICEKIEFPSEEKLQFLAEKRAFLLKLNLSSQKRKRLFFQLTEEDILNREDYQTVIDRMIEENLNDGMH